ncbi:MAG: alanine racemase [Chloroflexi bacterium]|nr:alanine racemase [Chloroflexota bacterium]MCC6891467.1 alanine racemase [Anaerolineae bacterium]
MTTQELYERIAHPTLLLDEAKCKRNIANMAAHARASGVRFRPHFKTHQSAKVGEWIRAEGVTSIAASSLRMAAYFADAGWDDILVAFPANWREIDLINSLASRIRLGLIVESRETVRFLGSHLQHPVDIWLDVDTGYHRTGIDWQAKDEAVGLAGQISASPMMRLRGMLTHSGQSYKSHNHAEIKAVYDESVGRFNSLRDHLAATGFTGLEVSLGDTPSCVTVQDLSAVEEVRPGNFVYFDWMQVVISTCTADEVAVALACPVVTKNAERNQIVVYGGGVHLSKDTFVDLKGRATFGAVCLPTDSGWSDPFEDTYVVSLSQEHGVLQVAPEDFDRIAIGSLVCILPVHSCMTADLMKTVVTLNGEELSMLHLEAL